MYSPKSVPTIVSSVSTGAVVAGRKSTSSAPGYSLHDTIFSIYFRTLYSQFPWAGIIGQSYGKIGEREAPDRLKNHSTLQRILAECQNKYAGYNIHILLFDFKQDQIGEIYKCGNLQTIITSEPHFDERQIINITEASLIHYFKPEFNKDFVSNFPCENHTSYSGIYDAACTELAIDLSYLFESEDFPSLSLHTDNNSITKEKSYIHYKLKEGQVVLSSYSFDNE